MFERPTLGHTVRLGELFDERTNQFLGVQLYREESIKYFTTVADVNRTDLSLSLSDSVTSKASILDVDPSLSLDVLTGLVKAKGSASYLKDSKSNSQVRSWAMALKMQTEERRLLFAENGLVHNVLRTLEETHVANGFATHIVSAVVYGGNVIIRMAESSREAVEEDLTRNLAVNLNNLKGLVPLTGEAAAHTKEDFSNLDNKFDLKVYADIELDKVPVNAKDILDIVPHAADLIRGGPPRLPKHSPQEGVRGDASAANIDGAANLEPKDRPIRGVPMFVTLQPIPKKLQYAAQADLAVFRLKQMVADEVLAVFSKLGDLRNRFTTLIDSMTAYKKVIPKLAERALASADVFAEDHLRLLRMLGHFIRGVRNGDEGRIEETNFVQIDSQIIISSEHPDDKDAPGSCKNSESNPSFLDKAKKLYATHSTAVDTTSLHSSKFPLVCLEKSFEDFQNLVYDIRRVPSGRLDLDGAILPSSFDTIDDVRRAPRHQDTIPLFLMTPSLDDPDSTLAVIRFRSLLNNRKTYHRRYLVYLEDSSDTKLVPHKDFLKLSESAYFLGKVDADGKLTWTRDDNDTKPDDDTPEASPELPLFASSKRPTKVVYHRAKRALSVPLKNIDGTKSFSVIFRFSDLQPKSFTGEFARLGCNKAWVSFYPRPFCARKQHGDYWTCDIDPNPIENATFSLTFVQDANDQEVSLYRNDVLINSTQLVAPSGDLGYKKWTLKLLDHFHGNFGRVLVYNVALTGEQVRDLTRFVPRGTSEDESRYELSGALKVHIVPCDDQLEPCRLTE